MFSFLSNIGTVWQEVSQMVERGFLPATALITKWLYDWQTLITGICALLAAHIWGRAIVRAAELRAGAVRQARSPVPRQAVSVAPSAAPPTRDLRSPPLESTLQNAPEAVEKLRAQIRAVLGRVPHTEVPLNPAQLSLCKSITSFTLDENSLKREAPREAYASLRQELSGLAALDERASCMTAWKALTSINKCARNLESALQGETLPAR